MLWIIWHLFTFSVVLAVLILIPIILYRQSQCVNIKVVNKEGKPMVGIAVYGVYEETAYATSVAGSYGGDTVYSRSPISSGTYTKRLGTTDVNGIFRTRIWLGRYWGLRFVCAGEQVSVLLDRFSTKQHFAPTPKKMVFDSSRSLIDPRWLND